jgi:hypothetical protein
MGDSKGKRIWGWVRIVNDFRWFIGWAFGLPWGVKVMTVMAPFVLLWVSIIKSMPWPVLMFCGLTVLFLIFVFMTGFFRVQTVSEVAVPPISKFLDLLLTAHGNNSPLLCLEVNNKGEDVNLTATIRVVSRSYGGPVDSRPYTGQWTLLSFKRKFGDHRPTPTASGVFIPTGRHRILEIANPDSGNGSGEVCAAYLIGCDEFLRWDFEQKPNNTLPFFRLQIEFRADGIQTPLCKLYDVGPVAAYGPLGMTEVEAA